MYESESVPSGETLPMRHTLDSSLPDGFPLPTPGERPYEVEVHHVGPEGWTSHWPPEDHALQPALDWTEAHRILVLDAHIRAGGGRQDDEVTHAIEWPPSAYLWTPGHVVEATLLTCAEHDEADCETCEALPLEPDTVSPAEWRWQAVIEVYERKDTSGSREDVETFQFMTTRMDPREVEYSEWPQR